MRISHKPVLVVATLWTVLAVLTLGLREAFVVDETRYLAVAWEMWTRGDWLVPHLNGEPYSHKPPLLFWLVDLGWRVFGVGDWWARSVAPLAALASLLLMDAIARMLWPERTRTAGLSAIVLTGIVPWAGLGTMTMFDTLVAACSLLALLGLLHADRGRCWLGWSLFGVGVGLGILAKGPVVAAFVLPSALLAPLWWNKRKPRAKGQFGGWYLGLAGGLTFGIAIALAWALPAARAGGTDYGNAILWGQTVGRVVDSFAHERPLWWYAVVLPIALAPWTFWPPVWKGFAAAVTADDRGVRFCLLWLIVPLVIMSMVSAKQVHYLLPLLPAFALLVGWRLGASELAGARIGRFLAASPFALLAIALLMTPLARHLMPEKLAQAPDWLGWNAVAVGAIVLLVATLVIAWPWRTLTMATSAIAAVPLSLLFALVIFVVPPASPYYGVETMSIHLRETLAAGRPLAYLGRHHGRFNFSARLTTPIAEINTDEVDDWFLAHPDGVLIAQHRDEPGDGRVQPLYSQDSRGIHMSLWDYAAYWDNRAILTE